MCMEGTVHWQNNATCFCRTPINIPESYFIYLLAQNLKYLKKIYLYKTERKTLGSMVFKKLIAI